MKKMLVYSIKPNNIDENDQSCEMKPFYIFRVLMNVWNDEGMSGIDNEKYDKLIKDSTLNHYV